MSFKGKWDYLRQHEAFRKKPALTLLRLALWRLRCWFRLPVNVTLMGGQLQMSLPPDWRGIAKLVYLFREDYERELRLLPRLLSPGGVFVDVGASFGIYTLIGSRLCGEAGRVFAFEPARRTFEILRNNIKRNRMTNVTTMGVALSADHETTLLYHHPDSSRNSLGKPADVCGEPEKVETRTLDSILMNLQVAKVDLIKADVEGAEELVLRGAIKTLADSRPAILFEVNPEATRDIGLRTEGAWKVMEGLGYRFFVLGESDELLEVASQPTGGNVLAIDIRHQK